MNRLREAHSPYLLQHADNPVHWLEWGEAAFREAAERDVPIFLSIGYATCHWCHVMEHESFEDRGVAELMNQFLVCIKVDREERPDIDDVYMTVCQLMRKQGGWPLTIVMTPDGRPFYAATYLPRESRSGRVGMMDLVPRLAELWRSDREQIEETANEIVRVLTHSAGETVAGLEIEERGTGIQPDWLEGAVSHLRRQFDPVGGGFGSAPKFPSPHNLSFLARWGAVPGAGPGAEEALSMCERTVHSMWHGGVFDQIGFGFHRYSTDPEWRLPHFEKMLYDQATMLNACVDVWAATGSASVRTVGLETARYVLRDLRHEEGAFFSAEDADSEGEEGRFYLWSQEELIQILGPEEGPKAVEWFSTEPSGNYLEEASGRRTGLNVLHPGSGARNRPQEVVLRAWRLALGNVRSKRVRPTRDEKILTDWNGLMIGSLARAGTAFEAPELVRAAQEAFSFLEAHLAGAEGRWLHRWFQGDAAIPAMLDDYAFLGSGLVELFLATSQARYLEAAIGLSESLLAECDAPDGGLYRSAASGESLLVRKQDWYDGAALSGASAAVGLLLKLARLTGRAAWEERADRLTGVASRVLSVAPGALTGYLAETAPVWAGGREIIVVAPSSEDPLLKEARRLPNPGGFVVWAPSAGPLREAMEQSVPLVRDLARENGAGIAYVCRNYACGLPVTDTAGLRSEVAKDDVSMGGGHVDP